MSNIKQIKICYLKKRKYLKKTKHLKLSGPHALVYIISVAVFRVKCVFFPSFCLQKHVGLFFCNFFYVHLIIVLCYFFFCFVSHNMPLIHTIHRFLCYSYQKRIFFFYYFFQFTSKEKVGLLINQIRPL